MTVAPVICQMDSHKSDRFESQGPRRLFSETKEVTLWNEPLCKMLDPVSRKVWSSFSSVQEVHGI